MDYWERKRLYDLKWKVKAVKKENMNDTHVQEVADALHKRYCKYNHIDMCAWDYDTWDSMGAYSSRPEWYRRALYLLWSEGDQIMSDLKNANDFDEKVRKARAEGI